MGAPCVDLLATLSLWGRQVPWEDAFWGCRLLFQPPLAGEDPSSTVGLCFVLYSLDKLCFIPKDKNSGASITASYPQY